MIILLMDEYLTLLGRFLALDYASLVALEKLCTYWSLLGRKKCLPSFLVVWIPFLLSISINCYVIYLADKGWEIMMSVDDRKHTFNEERLVLYVKCPSWVCPRQYVKEILSLLVIYYKNILPLEFAKGFQGAEGEAYLAGLLRKLLLKILMKSFGSCCL